MEIIILPNMGEKCSFWGSQPWGPAGEESTLQCPGRLAVISEVHSPEVLSVCWLGTGGCGNRGLGTDWSTVLGSPLCHYLAIVANLSWDLWLIRHFQGTLYTVIVHLLN